MNLDDVTTFTLDVQATPPESAGPATFTATGSSGQPAHSPPGHGAAGHRRPARPTAGSMTVSPLTVRAATATTLTFTYTQAVRPGLQLGR